MVGCWYFIQKYTGDELRFLSVGLKSMRHILLIICQLLMFIQEVVLRYTLLRYVQ